MNPKIKDLFFNNLLLLGFDKSPYEKHSQTCDKNMFSMPNQKMFEIVTHFLFSKLKGDYPLPWPLFDKAQIKVFQKSTFTYLSSISKESAIKFPRFTQSVISTAGKDRFYELYFAFSCHVLEENIQSKGNVDLLYLPKTPSSNCKNLLKLETISSTERTQHLIRFSRKYLEELVKCSSDFCSLISSLKSSYLTKRAELQEQTKQFCSLYSENEDKSSLPELFIKHLSYVMKVKDDWKSIQKFLVKEQILWQYLCSEIEGESVKYVLDSTHVDVSGLNALVSEDAEKSDNVKSSSEGGKPCLLRFLKLFAILLKSLLQTYLTGKPSNLLNQCKLENSWCLDENQKDIILLNNKVLQSLSDIQKSTETFQEEILAEEYSEEMESFIKEVQNWTFCSKSFHDKMKSTRSNASLPSKGGLSLLLTESSTEPSPGSLCEETEDIFVECSSQEMQLNTSVESSKTIVTEDSLKLSNGTQKDSNGMYDLAFDFDFGFNDTKTRLSCLSNVSLLDVSLPEDDEI